MNVPRSYWKKCSKILSAKTAICFPGKKLGDDHNGKRTDRLGVIAKESPLCQYRYIDMERTLIDVALRPAYAGGVSNVLKAFKKSKSKIDVPKLKDYLDKLEYIYPYHQCIGFYLQRAGFDEKDLTFFDGSKPFRFYLVHVMEYPCFDQRWNIYFQKEI